MFSHLLNYSCFCEITDWTDLSSFWHNKSTPLETISFSATMQGSPGHLSFAWDATAHVWTLRSTQFALIRDVENSHEALIPHVSDWHRSHPSASIRLTPSSSHRIPLLFSQIWLGVNLFCDLDRNFLFHYLHFWNFLLFKLTSIIIHKHPDFFQYFSIKTLWLYFQKKVWKVLYNIYHITLQIPAFVIPHGFMGFFFFLVGGHNYLNIRKEMNSLMSFLPFLFVHSAWPLLSSAVFSLRKSTHYLNPNTMILRKFSRLLRDSHTSY